jgi:hypothetical protein
MEDVETKTSRPGSNSERERDIITRSLPQFDHAAARSPRSTREWPGLSQTQNYVTELQLIGPIDKVQQTTFHPAILERPDGVANGDLTDGCSPSAASTTCVGGAKCSD